MAIKSILKQDAESSSVLNHPCRSVTEFNAELRQLVEDMWDSMYAARGMGLAATQIGSDLRVAVIDTPQSVNSHRHLVLINPIIEQVCGEQIGEEGCLSMPGMRWNIPRAMEVVFTYQDLDEKTHTRKARGLFARAVQHECDHLNGVLCNSHATEVTA